MPWHKTDVHCGHGILDKGFHAFMIRVSVLVNGEMSLSKVMLL